MPLDPVHLIALCIALATIGALFYVVAELRARLDEMTRAYDYLARAWPRGEE